MSSSEPVITLLASVGLSYLAYTLTATLVPLLGPDLIAKGLAGRDMLKRGFKRDEDALTTDTVAPPPQLQQSGNLL